MLVDEDDMTIGPVEMLKSVLVDSRPLEMELSKS